MLSTLKNGCIAGLQTAWNLSKFIFPITFIVTLLQFTPVLPWLLDLFEFLIGFEDIPFVKPYPAPILLAIVKLGLAKEDCIMIGDNYT